MRCPFCHTAVQHDCPASSAAMAELAGKRKSRKGNLKVQAALVKARAAAKAKREEK